MSGLSQLKGSEGFYALRIRGGVPPVIRTHGGLQRVEGPLLEPQDSEELMRSTTFGERSQGICQLGFSPAADSQQVAELKKDRFTNL
jgi:hypothetical protein